MSHFRYMPEILTAYPTLTAGVILAHSLSNHPADPSLSAAYRDEQQAVLAHVGATPLSELAPLAGWRAAFRKFGVDPTQYRSAPESLLRRLTKQGSLPEINVLVDLGNLISIRYGLAVAVVDTRAIHGTLSVHFADGSERYTTLNELEPEHPAQGEVIFSYEEKLVMAWCWRQSEQSAARLDTTDAIITIEGHHATASQDVQNALSDLLRLLQT
jgi:DNA/RNA-binding domain of Phe-tRNA-synthetase-like protein